MRSSTRAISARPPSSSLPWPGSGTPLPSSAFRQETGSSPSTATSSPAGPRCWSSGSGAATSTCGRQLRCRRQGRERAARERRRRHAPRQAPAQGRRRRRVAGRTRALQQWPGLRRPGDGRAAAGLLHPPRSCLVAAAGGDRPAPPGRRRPRAGRARSAPGASRLRCSAIRRSGPSSPATSTPT